MSVARYDEEPFPYQVEHYRDLERGQWIEVRQNDVQLPVGAKGVVMNKIAVTGNYQVAVQLEGEPRKRVIALCPDQVRPIEPPLPEELPKAAPPEPERRDRLSAEGRERQRQATKDYWARKKAERQAAAAAEPEQEKPKRKLAKKPAPDPALMTRHRPEGMDGKIAAAVHGEPEPPLVTELAEAIKKLQDYREPYAPSRSGSYLFEAAIANPPQRLVELTWTRRAADAIRPVLAEASAAGGDVTQLALLVETISYLEDGGRP